MSRMRQGGASYRQIAEAFQSSATTVRRVLQQEGVTP